MIACQFIFEAMGTGLIALGGEQLAFWVALAAIFLPILLSLYDAVIVPIILRLRTMEKIDANSLCRSFLGVILALPLSIAAAFGFDSKAFEAAFGLVEEATGL